MAVSDVVEWLAPIATMLAAVMTAANLGARVTGWGFVVFSLGSVCWVILGLDTGQNSLVVTNIFLSFVNVVGIWRWLGRQARYEALGDAAEAAGHSPAAASVLPASGLVGRTVIDARGKSVCEAVEAILDCRTGAIHHLVVRLGGVGGIGEHLVALPFADIRLDEKAITTHLSAKTIATLPQLDAGDWPHILGLDPSAAADSERVARVRALPRPG